MEVENQIPRDEMNAGADADPLANPVSEVQEPTATAEAAAPAVENPVEEPAAPEPPDRQLAADMVTRFLGHQGSKARDEVADLNDAEAWEVIQAAGDRFTARVNIKAIVSRAYDRRREEAAKEALGRDQAARRTSLAQAVLEQRDGLTAEAAADAVSQLKPEQLDELLAEPGDVS